MPQEEVALEFSGLELHRVLCKALIGEDEAGHGTKSRVADALGVLPQQYSRVLNRSGLAIVTVSRWLTRIPNVVMTQTGSSVRFFYRPE